MEVEREILTHYAVTDEGERLIARARLEGERTRELLRRFLPPAPADVLDIGGADGAYALPLARNGYRVHLIDPVARHVEAARANSEAQTDAPLAGVALGDARDLSGIADASVDAVLMLGPLYHLVEAADRSACPGRGATGAAAGRTFDGRRHLPVRLEHRRLGSRTSSRRAVRDDGP